MKKVLLSAVFVALASCSGSSEMPDLRSQLTPELVAKLPVKVMLVELPKAKSAALTGVDTVKSDTTTWRSLEDQTIALQHGVVIATRGLAFDLMGSEVGLLPENVINFSQSGESAVRSFSFLDGENVIRTVSYKCFYKVVEPTLVKRLSGEASLASVIEHCPKGGQDIMNQYYFDERSTQVTSRQWLGDTLGYAIVEFVN